MESANDRADRLFTPNRSVQLFLSVPTATHCELWQCPHLNAVGLKLAPLSLDREIKAYGSS